MCGIVGQFNLNGAPVSAESVQRMCDAIVHRGPDDEGLFVEGQIGLGMRRLSIIDLAGGHQPMRTPDGRLTIVFNGEIYNYRELRRTLEGKGYRFRTNSDTESILHAYEEFGVDCLTYLNGMFAIALWDATRRTLFVARDRLGIKPLYFYQDERELRFASEIKAIVTDSAVSTSIDPAAASYFFRYGYVAAPATMYQAIRKLPPAHYLLANASGVTTARYWSVDYTESPEPANVHFERVYALLRASVTRQLVADVPLGAFLSGGLDSSSIVSLMSEVTGTKVSTYSIGFGGPDAFHSELADAATVARHFSTTHHEIVVEHKVASLIERLVHHLDEPLADSSFVVTYLVSQLAVQTVKVILSGVGGDEIFGGYRRYLGPRLSPWYHAMPGPLRHLLQVVARRMPIDRGSSLRNYARLARTFLLAQGLGPFEQYDATVRVLDDATATRVAPSLMRPAGSLESARRDVYEGLVTIDPLHRAMRLDMDTSLAESLLLLTDKMTMAVSLEGRVPLLDHELVELAARVPASLKIKNTRLRHVQKEAMRGHLPEEVLRRRKRGFGFPVGAWFRRGFNELAGDVLSPARLRRQGLLEPKAISDLLDAHRQQREDYSDALLAALTFSIWADQR